MAFQLFLSYDHPDAIRLLAFGHDHSNRTQSQPTRPSYDHEQTFLEKSICYCKLLNEQSKGSN